MNTSPDHPDFTALALGEHIHGTPAQAVLEALRTSVAARHEAEQIRTTAGQLAFALKGLPPLRLDDARRNEVLKADIAAVRARFAEEDRAALADEPAPVVPRPPRTWIYTTAAAAAVAAAAIVVMKFLPGYTLPSQRNLTPVVENNPEQTGQVNVTPVVPQDPVRQRPQVPAPAPTVVDHAIEPPLPDAGQELPATQHRSPPPPLPIVKGPTPVIPPLPAPRSPASPSLPPEAIDPSSVKRKIDPGRLAVPPPKQR